MHFSGSNILESQLTPAQRKEGQRIKVSPDVSPELEQLVLRARLVDRVALRRVIESETKVVFVG
jgi:hypothetical protein